MTVEMRVDEVQFVHFNDVREFAASNPASQTLTLFSGDAFSPSLEASVLKGAQVCPLLNLVGVDIGCYGNHDFDFGDARLIELSSQLKFPWLLSNAFHLPKDQRRTLGSAREYIVRNLENGLKVGFIGLAGTDWPSNCELLPPCEFEPPVQAARRLARHLRVQERCDLVVALTHMRVPEDMAVANATVSGDSRIDLLLGGHDHDVLRRGKYKARKKRDRLERLVAGTVDCATRREWNRSSINGEPPTHVVETLQGIHDQVGKLVQRPLLHAATPIDGRNAMIRSQETNMGNMLADAVRAFYDADIGFFNSGAVRSDCILGAADLDGEPLLVRDIINICPFGNSVLVKKMPSSIIRLALENSVSDMHTDGRFLQVSGLRVVASWDRPEWSRVVDVFLQRPDGALEPLDPDRTYTVAMPSFIARGYDGFSWFAQLETLVGEEAAVTDVGLLLAIFGHEQSSDGDMHAIGIERARAVTIVGQNPTDSLPIVKPVVEDRIKFV
ncbi:Metallo-dependent phosphatase-like protein [Aspergillus tetrazonus]